MRKIIGVVVVVFLFLTCFEIMDAPVSSALAVGDSWGEKAHMNVGRAFLGAAVVDGKIYAIGGTFSDSNTPLSVNEVYDPVNDSWTFKQVMPTERCMFAVAVWQDKIYCIGGSARINGSIQVTGLNQVYDPANDSWETKASMPTPRSYMSANVVDGKIYVMGGADVNISHITVNEVYDPANDTWTTGKAPVPDSSIWSASAVYDNKIYVIGGYQAGSKNRMYDPQTDTWYYKASPPLAFAGSGAVTSGVLTPEQIYVFSYGNAVEIYNPVNDSWVLGTQMPSSRDGLGVACVDDQFYVLGGETLNWLFSLYTGTTRYNLNEMYTPADFGSVLPKVSFLSAMNQTYNVSSVSVNFTVNRAFNWAGYSFDGQPTVTVDGNITLANVTNGVHWLTVYVNDTFGNYVASQALNFTVAVPPKPSPFPTLNIAAMTGTVVAVISVIGILVYRKRRFKT
jgi:N-acetylneuraminic acid mutarotase